MTDTTQHTSSLAKLSDLAETITATVAERDDKLARRNDRIKALTARGIVSRAIAEPAGLTASRVRQIAGPNTTESRREELETIDHVNLGWLTRVRDSLIELENELTHLREDRDDLLRETIAAGQSIKGAARAAGVGRTWAMHALHS